jgi:hypothetical protein
LEALNVHLSSLSLDDAGMSLAQVMRKEEYLTRLVGVLTKFTKVQSGWSPGDETPSMNDEFSIVLNDTFPVEVKAIVYEIQVHTLLGMTHHGQYATARRICRQSLDLYDGNQYPIRRVRVIERLLYLAIVEGEESEDLLDLGSTAVTTLTTTKVRFTNAILTIGIWQGRGIDFFPETSPRSLSCMDGFAIRKHRRAEERILLSSPLDMDSVVR